MQMIGAWNHAQNSEWYLEAISFYHDLTGKLQDALEVNKLSSEHNFVIHIAIVSFI